jgi:hypothetical protein
VYTSAFIANNILSSFAATGVHPRNADAVLKRLPNTTKQRDTDTKLGDYGDGDSFRQLLHLVEAAVPDTSAVTAKQLSQAVHSLQINNELLHVENEQLRSEITTKKQQKKHNQILDLQQHQEYESLAVVWSPRAVREARHRKAIQQQEEEEEQRQKQQDREARAEAIACRKQLEAAARVQRQEAKMVRRKEREARATQLAAARAAKAEERAAATTKKSRDIQNTPIRKTLSSQKLKKTRRGGVTAAQSGGVGSEPATKPPTKTTTRGRDIKLPSRYE